jgi:glutamyl-tRNA synthetase
MGYLPAAMRNYLVRLGWSHGDQEIFSNAEMIQFFDLPQIGRSPARLDLAKLENVNGHYMRQSGDQELVAALQDFVPHIAGGPEIAAKLTPAVREKLVAAMPALKERAKTLVDLVEGARFIWAERPLSLDEKAKSLLTPEARGLLADLIAELGAVAPWNAQTTEAVIRSFSERRNVKLGAVAQPLRAALSGRTTSPPIFDVLAVLGKEESLGRIADQAAETAVSA